MVGLGPKPPPSRKGTGTCTRPSPAPPSRLWCPVARGVANGAVVAAARGVLASGMPATGVSLLFVSCFLSHSSSLPRTDHHSGTHFKLLLSPSSCSRPAPKSRVTRAGRTEGKVGITYSRRSCAASTRTWLLNRTAPAVTSPASFWPSRPIFFPTHPRLAASLQQSTDCCTSFLLCPGAGSRTTIPQFRPPEAVGMATPPGKLRNLLYPNHNRRRPLPHQRAYPQHLPHTSNPSIREGKALCAQSPV